MANANTRQGPHSAAQQTNAIQPKICNYCEQIIKEDEYETKPIPGHATCKLVLQCVKCKESVHAKCASMYLMVLKAKDKQEPNWRHGWSCRICIWDIYQQSYSLTDRQLMNLNDVTWNLECKLGNIEQKLDFMGKYEEQLKINEEMNKDIQALKKEISCMKQETIKEILSTKQEANKEIQSLENTISTMMKIGIKSNEPNQDPIHEK